MTPRTAETLDDVCSLKRDNVHTDKFWMLLDGATVCITEQQIGSPATASIRIPNEIFNRFIDWYNTGEWEAKAA